MPECPSIRRVTLELLRAGPPHNQLLSPLTQYLAVCGDSGATVVTLPYEHAEFERRLDELRYSVRSGDTKQRRAGVLNQTGYELAKILGAVPALTGELTSRNKEREPVTHLRMVFSATELALLPFEDLDGGSLILVSWSYDFYFRSHGAGEGFDR